MIKRTSYLKHILSLKDLEIIKIIKGIYGVGKSTLLRQYRDELLDLGISEEQIILIDFNNLENKDLLDYLKLHEYLKNKSKEINKKLYILCDDIQLVYNWEFTVNSLSITIDCDIYLTISSDRFLTTEHSTYIAGRYISINVYPFSFSEFYLANKETNNLTKKQCFNKYLKVGGMPYLSTLEYNEKQAKNYLYSEFNKIILEYLYKENNVKHSNKILNIISYVINLMSQTSTPWIFADKLKEDNIAITNKKARNYIYDFLQSYLLIESMILDLKLDCTKFENNYYLADHSFYNLFGYNNINAILKNIVYLELLRRNNRVDIGSINNEEMAFICCNKNSKSDFSYYMVCDKINNDENVKRIYNIYKKEDLKYPKYILSLDEKDMSEEQIKHINIIDFLLSEN